MKDKARLTPVGKFMSIGVLLTFVMVLLGSVRFARFDWTGLPLDRGPVSTERQVGPCLEKIGTFTTESDRVIKPVVVDEMQYMAMVRYYRGEPAADLPVECMYSPFAERVGVPWLASLLPGGDEGVSLAVVNSLLAIVGLWFVLAALREQGFAPLPLFAAGFLYAASWNTLMFSSGILVDGSVVAAVAASWYLIVRKWVWLVPLTVFVGSSLKETVIIVVPVMFVWAWNEFRNGPERSPRPFIPAIATAVAYLAGTFLWHEVALHTRASWGATPTLGAFGNNISDLVSMFAFAVGVLPLFLPSVLMFRRHLSARGWLNAALDPATVGVAFAAAVCAYSLLTADLSPRLFWIGYPFAASMTADWFSSGRPLEWLSSRRLSRTG